MSEKQRLRLILDSIRFAMDRSTSRERQGYQMLLNSLRFYSNELARASETPPPIDQKLIWETSSGKP